MNYKEIETTQEEVLQSLVEAGIELAPSDTTLGGADGHSNKIQGL